MNRIQFGLFLVCKTCEALMNTVTTNLHHHKEHFKKLVIDLLFFIGLLERKYRKFLLVVDKSVIFYIYV